MEFSMMRLEQQGPVALLTINRPPVNALNQALLHELFGAVGMVSRMQGVRALVVTGEGKAFVAGADIAEMQNMSVSEATNFSAMGQAVFSSLEALSIPVIAAVNGFALGGGCELAMSCDIILAGPKAVFGQPEVKLGVIPGFGGLSVSLVWSGCSAPRMQYTGRYVKAAEAVGIGLALAVSEGDVVADAIALGNQMAANGPYAVSLVKRAVNETEGAPPSSGYAQERNLFGMCFASADQKEGMAAFLGKRAAQFEGK